MIAIASDHAGYELKGSIIEWFKSESIEYIDLGTDSKERVDYPDYAYRVVRAIKSGECMRGVLICGTGVGMSIVANRFKGIRAAVVSNLKSAKMCRLHNDANIICLGGRILTRERAIRYIEIWLKEEFEGGRHLRRIERIEELSEEGMKDET
jgi:ribose 5-phosphate isomerase B